MNPKLKLLLASQDGEDAKRVLQMVLGSFQHTGREEVLYDSLLGDEKENTSFPRQREEPFLFVEQLACFPLPGKIPNYFTGCLSKAHIIHY